jgi:N-acetylglutamate synthase-like GNAT family acetyltransferase
MAETITLRLATPDDTAALHDLIAASVRGLMEGEYSSAQLEEALGTWLGLDSQLIADKTYFIAEAEGNIVGCGGWSKRKTPFGSDHRPGRENALLDPATDAAKIRAFFIHPDWGRRGIGTMIMQRCEQEAEAAGFRACEMGATLTGIPLYKRFGYTQQTREDLPLKSGGSFPIVRMYKRFV